MAGPINDALGNASGAVGSLFAGFASEKKADMFRIQAKADLLKGEGDLLEKENYLKAGDLALKNKAFSEESTAVQVAQSSRALTMSLGAARASFGASGLAEDGSATDVLAASAQQGQLEKDLLEKQGLITGAGYQEQFETYQNMSEAAQLAADSQKLAAEGHNLAAEAEDQAATGNYLQAGIKGISAIASLFSGGVAPAPGG